MPKNARAKVSFELAADNRIDTNRRVCLASEHSTGTCAIATDIGRYGACTDKCQEVELTLDADGHQIEGIVARELPVDIATCRVVQPSSGRR